MKPVLVLALILALQGNPKNHAHYFALGASETSGFGLHHDGAYPGLVSRACGLPVTVLARAFVPALYEPVPRITKDDIVSIFMDVNTISRFDRSMATQLSRRIALFAKAKMVIVILPPRASRLPGLRYVASTLGDKETLLRSDLRRAHGITLIELNNIRSLSGLLQRDGTHPNEQGQITIALILNRNLKARGACHMRTSH